MLVKKGFEFELLEPEIKGKERKEIRQTDRQCESIY